MSKKISPQLQELVSWSVRTLGEGIKQQFGNETFQEIEKIRKKMKTLRGQDEDQVFKTLSKQLEIFKNKTDDELACITHSFSLMLELTNRCENAYRAFKLENTELSIPTKRPHAIIFVLTAHPTEARSTEILGLFELVQNLLIKALKNGFQVYDDELKHLLLISLKVSLARAAKPTVADEAQNIYSYILKDEILETLIKFAAMDINVSLRSWVGGDKDGHPGVDEETLLLSLNQSRVRLVEFIDKKLNRLLEFMSYIPEEENYELSSLIKLNLHQLKDCRNIETNDGLRISEFKHTFQKLKDSYLEKVGLHSPELLDIDNLLWVFPAIVVALEVREDSSVVANALEHPGEFAIYKMLQTLKRISKGFEAKWYVRGFVLSMVDSSTDISNGLKLVKQVFDNYEIPVVPLFENEKALKNAQNILQEILTKQKSISKKHISKWGSRYEVMVGYSDSSKENGVLPSRMMISNALGKIEKELARFDLVPVFFHGSGGSIERGGGSIKEQTAWWPKSAINIYKATIQGEMVARNFGSQYILQKQVQTILHQLADHNKVKKSSSVALNQFVQKVRKAYAEKIQEDDFMQVIQLATPYSFLHHLKIGSRPTKRAGGEIKNNLRAIPWILCWTQTRILFPTWWGIGSAWSSLSKSKQTEFVKHADHPVINSYIKALGFTLAKVELGVWKLYLENSEIDKDLCEKTYQDFLAEFEQTKLFFKKMTKNKEFLWFRPWLQQSIDYRSSMIHPLNLCQIESLRRRDHNLLRSSVTGIACGMLTTG